MGDRSLQAGSGGQVLPAALRGELEQDAFRIADSLRWDKVAQLVQCNPSMPSFFATYVCDRRARESFHARSASAFDSVFVDMLVIAAVQIEAAAPRYLALPDIIASVASEAHFAEARPLGRLLYRMGMHQEVRAEIDEEQLVQAVQHHGREAVMKAVQEWDGEWYRLEYVPRRFEQKEVFDLVDDIVRGHDRRFALSTSLAWRVGCVVGFLSSLAVSQPDEAQAAMVILAGLVAPLLPRPVLQAGMSSRRIAPAKGKGGRKSGYQSHEMCSF